MSMTTPTRSFTLVETLVAISVLAVAILGPFVAIQNAITASYVARDQLIASLLAQEGMEYVRGVRDNNYLYRLNHVGTTRTWIYGLDGTAGSVNCIDPNPSDSTAVKCTVDSTNNTPIAQCPSNGSGTCSPLNLSATSNLYTQASGHPATRFTRSVTLVNISATQVLVTVTVTWSTNQKPYSVILTQRLHDWL